MTAAWRELIASATAFVLFMGGAFALLAGSSTPNWPVLDVGGAAIASSAFAFFLRKSRPIVGLSVMFVVVVAGAFLLIGIP